MDNQQLETKVEKFAVFTVIVFNCANWIISGYLAWYWIHPDSFFRAILFIISWAILSGVGKNIILPLVLMAIFAIGTLLKKPHSPAISPSQNPLPYIPANQKKPNKDYASWIIFGFIGLCVLSYFYIKSDNNQSKTANTNNYSSTQNSSSNDYTKSQTPTAQCYDGTYSYSTNHRGTCSHHGGVRSWNPSQQPITDFSNIPTTAPIPNPTASTTAQLPPELSVQPPVTTPPPAPTPSTDKQVAQAQAEYHVQIANLNQAWKQLTPSGRKQILTDQRLFNQKRETECQQYALTMTNDTNQQTTANLLCQIERLKQRTQYLKTYVHTTTGIPSNLPNNPSQGAKKVETPQVPELEKTKQSYNMAIGTLNLTWGKLDPKLKESIRLEQRADNQQRESQCQKYAQSLENNSSEKEMARLSCEIPLIQERTEYLRNLTNGVDDD